MKIQFVFDGYAEVDFDSVVDSETGESIDITKMKEDEVLSKLNNGTYCISFEDALQNAIRYDVDINSYESVDEVNKALFDK